MGAALWKECVDVDVSDLSQIEPKKIFCFQNRGNHK